MDLLRILVESLVIFVDDVVNEYEELFEYERRRCKNLLRQQLGLALFIFSNSIYIPSAIGYINKRSWFDKNIFKIMNTDWHH
jgi:hypothetical protein